MVQEPVRRREEPTRAVHQAMVNFATTLNEEQVRSLMEGLAAMSKSGKIMHSGSQCLAKIPAVKINDKTFKGNEALVHLIWTRSTRKVQVQAGAAIMNKAKKHGEHLYKVYGKLIDDDKVEAPEDEAEKAAETSVGKTSAG